MEPVLLPAASQIPPADILLAGAMGDLARKKIMPALYQRFIAGQLLPESRIWGLDRTTTTTDGWCQALQPILEASPGGSATDFARFAAMLHYRQGDVGDTATLTALAAEMQHEIRVIYAAIRPDLYVPLCQAAAAAGLMGEHTRVVLEKPLGEDLTSFEQLDAGVSKIVPESKLYRIDHYLGKETVQNLMVLRFANPLFAQAWDARMIDHVQITVAETIGVEGRAAYYDHAGALRDMVQNHLLQLLCLVAMEPPSRIDPEQVRAEKRKVLQSLRPMASAEDIARGQYEGYTQDIGAESSTETFVALRCHIDNWRWSGVPFYLRTGKKMRTRLSEVIVQFKPAPYHLFEGMDTMPNRLIIRLQPDESVRVQMVTKTPGPGGYRVQPMTLNVSYAETFHHPLPEAYERLLMDVVRGNPTLFMSGDEVRAAWSWIDGVRAAWGQTPLETYAPGSWGPESSERMMTQEGRQWWKPS